MLINELPLFRLVSFMGFVQLTYLRRILTPCSRITANARANV